MTGGIDPKNIVGSIIKGTELLDLFSIERREITLSEFAAETKFNKTTTHRLLQTLIAAGLLTRTPAGGYRLGIKLLVLGAIARADLDLRSVALPFMRELADESGDTAFLMVPSHAGALTIETTIGANPVQVRGMKVGTVLPYHVAAGPVVLAAFSPNIEEALMKSERKAYTPKTVLEVSALQARFAAIRQIGHSLSMDDYIEGVAAVGAPVLGRDGSAIASLSIGGPSSRFSEGVREQTIQLVVEAAAAVSARV